MKFGLTVFIIFLSVSLQSQAVSISSTGDAPHSSSMLHVKSSTKGLLIPRLQSSQRMSIPSPAEGLLVYDVDEHAFSFYKDGQWQMLSDWSTDIDSLNELQTINISGDTLYLSKNGGFIPVDNISYWSKIVDTLTYTGAVKINGRLQLSDSGSSVYVGLHAGLSDDESNNQNTGVGTDVMRNTSTGAFNTAMGYMALTTNSTGQQNTAVGIRSLEKNESGSFNVAIGRRSLNANTLGEYNTAVGYNAMRDNITGINNTSMGRASLYNNTEGNSNIAVGRGAMHNNISGNANTAMGSQAMYNNTVISNLVAIGDSTLYHNGDGASGVLEGTGHTAVGSKALYHNTTGYRNTAVGSLAQHHNTTGFANISLGYKSLFSNTTGSGNIGIGNASLLNNTTGTHNIAIGITSLRAITSGKSNIGIGHQALYSANTGDENIAIGDSALVDNTIGYQNISIGKFSSQSNTTGHDNIAIGKNALSNNTTDDGSVAIGYEAIHNLEDGNYNTAMGYEAGIGLLEGGNNTMVGYRANINSFSSIVSNSTVIGAESYVPFSNAVRLGNTFVTSIGGEVNWVALSDGRFKRNIKENISGLEFINLLRPVSYTLDVRAIEDFKYGTDRERHTTYPEQYEKETIRYTGFIAQEVEAAAEALSFDFSGVEKPKNEYCHYGLRYAEFVVPLVKAVQELYDENEVLKKENKQLVTALEEMHARLEKIESSLSTIGVQN